MTKIHKTAIIGNNVILGDNVEIGPYSVIEEGVEIGDGCWFGNHVNIRKGTRIGANCCVYHGAVIGQNPQDITFKGGDTHVELGESVTIGEFVTISRGTESRGKTVIGNHSYLMTYVHVGHDCTLGEHVILTNCVQISGHVIIDDWVNIGGMTPVHQFCRIGKHAFIGGGFRVVKDVPPYILAAGEPLKFSGINMVGLRRSGFSPAMRKMIKNVYRLIYQSPLNTTQAIEEIKNKLPRSDEMEEIISFVEASERGII